MKSTSHNLHIKFNKDMNMDIIWIQLLFFLETPCMFVHSTFYFNRCKLVIDMILVLIFTEIPKAYVLYTIYLNDKANKNNK